MITFKIELTDIDGGMRIHMEGDTIQPSTEYEVDFAEALMTDIYNSCHRIAKEHGDTSFADAIPLEMHKRKPKKP